MSKNKNKSRRGQSKNADTNASASPSVEALQRSRNIRETVESVAIAFILAFLFRTFEAEAFVIPTGSMAPTLQGRHKDADCPQCGYRCRVSASGELDDSQEAVKGQEIVTATCPICRYTMTLDPEPRDLVAWPADEIEAGKDQVAYNGDRILVTKFTYEFSDPERWDVVVFKFPGDSKLNYIKRLVGLPNEEVKIFQGDIFVRQNGTQAPFQIARKPPRKVQAMQQIVHDNHYIPSDLVEGGWPTRWSVWPLDEEASDGSWKMDLNTDEKVAKQNFSIDGSAESDRWIRYRHLIPSFNVWRDIQVEPLPENDPRRPQLITDFYAYNTGRVRQERDSNFVQLSKEGLHWVGDLMVECDVEVQSEQGELLIDLVEGGVHFTCRLDVATGKATLSDSGDLKLNATCQTTLKGAGSYEVSLANVDDQLLLWVDGELADIEEGSNQFERTGNVVPVSTAEDAGDLSPVGIGSSGASLNVTGLRVKRDIYYIADEYRNQGSRAITDYGDLNLPLGYLNQSKREFVEFLSDPSQWGVFEKRGAEVFPLESDQFFVLGDNSPFSKDSRLWGEGGLGHHVDRKFLVGKALFIYWPHSWDRVPGTGIPFPFFPNFSDMGFVR